MGIKDTIFNKMDDFGSQIFKKSKSDADLGLLTATVRPGRKIAIGDIHGCADALKYLLELLEPSIEDTVITLGDYIDRGPDSKSVINTLIDLKHNCHLVCLRGNHEEIMVKARENLKLYKSWYNQVGGAITLYSYAGPDKKGLMRNVPEEHWEFLTKTLRNFYETENHLFVHAVALPDLPLRKQPLSALHWDRFDTIKPHSSGKQIVCGHTAQRSGRPVNLGYAVNIDTYAYGKGGYLSAYDIGAGLIYQANQDGDLRYAKVDDFSKKNPVESPWTPISTLTA